MERVRRVVSNGGFNYVAVVGEELVVGCDKVGVMVFDSMNPTEDEEVRMEEVEKIERGEKETPVFYWKQSEDDLDLWWYVESGVGKKNVKVRVSGGTVSVDVGGLEMISGRLWGGVEEDSVTWSLEGGKLGLLLMKESVGLWEGIWKEGEGSVGEQVNDFTADNLLQHLTTDNPVPQTDSQNQPSNFHNEMEECDIGPEGSSSLMWFNTGRHPSHASSLSGHAHIMVVPQRPPHPPAIATRHDVDAFLWSPGDKCPAHIATFPALGYVQASKSQRKFCLAPEDNSYSAIADSARHVYVYRQPRSIEGAELRNRKTGRRVAGVAVQQVVTLDSSQEILGVVATPHQMWILTDDALYRAQVENNQQN